MYFSTSQSGNKHAAKIVATTAKEFGLTLATPEYAHVPFEAVVAAISKAKSLPPERIATELMALAPEQRKGALIVGSAELVKGFGSEAQTMEFFRSVADPRATVRFEGVGGISDDLRTVKNRLASVAADAYLQRQVGDADGLLPVEREYVDLMKSVRRTLELAVENNSIAPGVAEALVKEVQDAVARVSLDDMSRYVAPLHEIATEELYDEALERVRKRYAVAPSNDGPGMQ